MLTRVFLSFCLVREGGGGPANAAALQAYVDLFAWYMMAGCSDFTFFLRSRLEAAERMAIFCVNMLVIDEALARVGVHSFLLRNATISRCRQASGVIYCCANN